MSTDLKPDEELVLLPVVATRTTDGWATTMHAWVHEPDRDAGRRRLARLPLRLSLGLVDSDGSSDVFVRRAQVFLADNERHKIVVVDIAGDRYRLSGTDADGHSRTDLVLPADVLTSGPLRVQAVLPDGDSRQVSGVIHPLPAHGMSVISDIDDTIKITDVRHTREKVRNTFLREFASVPGMAAVYARWAGQGVGFHYVSASPWQLYADLSALLAGDGFPPGSVHLKPFRWRDESFFSLFQHPLEYKTNIIRRLLAGCAPRRFVLVGDSGEVDPEVYAATYRDAPSRVHHIFIRDVTGEPREAERYTRAFAGVPADRWTVFTSPESLPAVL